ncbi:DUF4305 domain-containing protein [Shouchella xiaoxiensis]|uniref:DUF4305 domain-containing protein n=1 Tax=Shouchella xiaoxiensis TaxID=766895 RepID=UPI00195820DA
MKMIGFFYFILGFLFVFLTYQQVEANGWGFFAFLLAFMATFDFFLGWRSFRRKPPTSSN